MTVGERLLELRKKKGLSQEEVANILNVSRQTVSKWEVGESTPDFDKILPICNLFNITSDELLTGKKDIIVEKDNDRRRIFARNLAIAIGLYIFSIVLIILFATLFASPIIGVCLFFIVIAIATGLIVYTAINYGSKKEQTEEDKRLKLVCEIIDIIGVVVYFLISFKTGAWHITWIIFLIIGLLETIAKLIFSLNKKEENDNE